MNRPLESPCVRNCCLDEKDICLGCMRHIDEIVGWVELSEQQKREVLENIEVRKTQYQPLKIFR